MSIDNSKVWVSQYNTLPEVLGESYLPKRLMIYDTTLRDGEQTAGLCFTKHDKLEIAKLLDELGVDRIEAGMPVVSKEDFEAVQMILDAGLKADIWGFCRCVKADIDACVAAGVKSVVCEIATSPLKIKAYGWTEDRVAKNLVEHLLYAKEKGLYTAYFSVDCTRTDLSFLEHVYKSAVHDGHADEVVVVDTLGVANPETMFYLTKKLREWVDVPVSVHCHNDFGMGASCTLASVKAGADCAHVTINAIGEKTGNVDIAETVMAAQILYGMETNVKIDKLYKVAKRVEQITGIPLPPQKPIVGEAVFKRESGVVIAQMSQFPPAVEGYDPELLGRSREVVLGKKSGKNSIEMMLDRRGLKAAPEQIVEMLNRVKDLGLKKKSIVTDEEFDVIVKEVLG